ncbi:hypothetical protein NONO_c74170 [Nocardia nova SH22a]|uniref:DNA primase/polymerase bifunctional N-terminal domain-containing protein n=2 Tax=Nocardia nova TaxID=37330 RepID=W5TSA5_9NOCA|nr:hypothetical protein NONO_c74170 [Nocardia nova SH22a]
MFERCHTAHEVAHVYRSLGFEVSCVFDRASLIAGLRVGAVCMPPDIGAAVRNLMNCVRPVHAPVFSSTYRSSKREWIFLVGPPWSPAVETHERQLAQAGVRLLVSGQRLWLPMSDNPIGWFWLEEPRGETLPSRTNVLEAARHVLRRRARVR